MWFALFLMSTAVLALGVFGSVVLRDDTALPLVVVGLVWTLVAATFTSVATTLVVAVFGLAMFGVVVAARVAYANQQD